MIHTFEICDFFMKCQKVEMLEVLPNNCAIGISEMILKALIRSCWTTDWQKNKEILLLKATRKWQKNQAQKNNFHRQRASPKKRGRFLMIDHVLIDVFRFLRNFKQIY